MLLLNIFFCSNINKIKYLQDLLKIVEYNNILISQVNNEFFFYKFFENPYGHTMIFRNEFGCLNVKKIYNNFLVFLIYILKI